MINMSNFLASFFLTFLSFSFSSFSQTQLSDPSAIDRMAYTNAMKNHVLTQHDLGTIAKGIMLKDDIDKGTFNPTTMMQKFFQIDRLDAQIRQEMDTGKFKDPYLDYLKKFLDLGGEAVNIPTKETVALGLTFKSMSLFMNIVEGMADNKYAPERHAQATTSFMNQFDYAVNGQEEVWDAIWDWSQKNPDQSAVLFDLGKAVGVNTNMTAEQIWEQNPSEGIKQQIILAMIDFKNHVISKEELDQRLSELTAQFHAEMEQKIAEVNDKLKNIEEMLTENKTNAMALLEKQNKQDEFQLKLDVVLSSTNFLTGMFRLIGDNASAQAINLLGQTTAQVMVAFNKFENSVGKFSTLATLNLSFDLMGLALNIVSNLLQTGPSFETMVMDRLNQIFESIATLHEQMHQRFDQVDQKLTHIYETSRNQFYFLRAQLEQNHQDHVNLFNLSVDIFNQLSSTRVQIQELSFQLFNVEKNLSEKLDWIIDNQKQRHLNTCLKSFRSQTTTSDITEDQFTNYCLIEFKSNYQATKRSYQDDVDALSSNVTNLIDLTQLYNRWFGSNAKDRISDLGFLSQVSLWRWNVNLLPNTKNLLDIENWINSTYVYTTTIMDWPQFTLSTGDLENLYLEDGKQIVTALKRIKHPDIINNAANLVEIQFDELNQKVSQTYTDYENKYFGHVNYMAEVDQVFQPGYAPIANRNPLFGRHMTYCPERNSDQLAQQLHHNDIPAGLERFIPQYILNYTQMKNETFKVCYWAMFGGETQTQGTSISDVEWKEKRYRINPNPDLPPWQYEVVIGHVVTEDFTTLMRPTLFVEIYRQGSNVPFVLLRADGQNWQSMRAVRRVTHIRKDNSSSQSEQITFTQPYPAYTYIKTQEWDNGAGLRNTFSEVAHVVSDDEKERAIILSNRERLVDNSLSLIASDRSPLRNVAMNQESQNIRSDLREHMDLVRHNITERIQSDLCKAFDGSTNPDIAPVMDSIKKLHAAKYLLQTLFEIGLPQTDSRDDVRSYFTGEAHMLDISRLKKLLCEQKQDLEALLAIRTMDRTYRYDERTKMEQFRVLLGQLFDSDWANEEEENLSLFIQNARLSILVKEIEERAQ